MGLVSRLTLLVVLSFISTDIWAQSSEEDFLTITSSEVREVTDETNLKNFNYYDTGPVGRVGKVIAVGRDLVALGQDIYNLVQKGKPTVKTNYAPISIMPKAADTTDLLMETENWKMPRKVSYEISFYNMYKMEVVKFRYSVFFSYGGSFQGKGAYITAAQIIPEFVSTLFGFDFTATLKLAGFQNIGTRANPVAGATLLMEYTASSLIKAITKVDTFFITGQGKIKRL